VTQTSRQFPIPASNLHAVSCCLIEIETLTDWVETFHILSSRIAVLDDILQSINVAGFSMCFPTCEVLRGCELLSAKHWFRCRSLTLIESHRSHPKSSVL
jgi:hypothetical protein